MEGEPGGTAIRCEVGSHALCWRLERLHEGIRGTTRGASGKPKRVSSLRPIHWPRERSKRLQKLNEVLLLGVGETQLEEVVVMPNDVWQRQRAAVVEVGRMLPRRPQGR